MFERSEKMQAMQCMHMFGVVTLVYLGLKFILWTYRFYRVYFAKAGVDYRSFGQWALVTGSTDGIGKGIAFELAKRGLNIVLVSRNLVKLESVAHEIEEKFNVNTKCIVIDFSKTDNLDDGGEITSSMYDVIVDGIKGLEVGVLVNNVGLAAYGEFLNAFSKSDNKDIPTGIPRLICCNDMSTARVTAIVLPGMVEREKGLVINVSSLAATAVTPSGALYSGSKRFDDVFTKALRYEYKDKGIIFQCVQPGPVRTNMTSTQTRKATSFYPEYQTYSQHLMETVGKDIETTGYFYHGLLGIVLSILPEAFTSRLLLKREKAIK